MPQLFNHCFMSRVKHCPPGLAWWWMCVTPQQSAPFMWEAEAQPPMPQHCEIVLSKKMILIFGFLLFKN